MLHAAERMRSLGVRAADSGAPSSIFGSAGSLAQSIQTDDRYRISIYPFISPEPELAMGLASCLAYLLEQYDGARVYRCFAKIEAEDDSGEISRDDYQFTVDQWALDGLADNVQIHGSLTGSAGDLTLEITLDAGPVSGDDQLCLTYEFPSLEAATSELPNIAAAIIGELQDEAGGQPVISYAALEAGSGDLRQMLGYVFEWNLDVYLYFWDVPWDEDEIRTQYQASAALCRAWPSEFAYWCQGMMAWQVLQAGLDEIGDTVIPLLEASFGDHPQAVPGITLAALGLSNMEYHARAEAMLRPHVHNEAPASVWNGMTDIQLAAGDFDLALDTCQDALEKGVLAPAMLWRYVELLITAETNGWEIADVLLIDPDEFDEAEHTSREIANALKLYLERKPGDQPARQFALTYLIDTDDADLWHEFEQLLRQDTEGEYTGEVVERLIDLDDLGPAYEILERHLDANPYAYVYLAQLSLYEEDAGRATELIRACRERYASIDDDLELELQWLELYARAPDFEESFAEIKVMLNAKRHISNDYFETLESALEIAPLMADLYVILSLCYSSQNDNGNALEVLAEGKANAGPHPQILLRIAQILWASDQKSQAIESLNDALSANSNDVPLLAQMSQFLIDNGQLDDARQYIARAEMIAPSHRAIWQLRRLVAQRVG